MAQPVLHRFETTVLKNKSGSDAAQVPAAATIDFYRQGATAVQPVTIDPLEFDVAVQVYEVGRIELQDKLKVGPAGAATLETLQVSDIDVTVSPPVIKVGSLTQNQVVISAGDRLIPVQDRPKVHAKPLATDTGTVSIQTDSGTGRASAYTNTHRFDYVVSGTGFSPRLFIDATAAPSRIAPAVPVIQPVRSSLDWINVLDFASFQEAVAAVPPSGGVIYAPNGVYEGDSKPSFRGPLLLPTDRPIRLVGDGPERTVLRYAFIGSTGYNPNNDLVVIRAEDQSIENLTLEGGLNNPAGTGVGVRISRVGTPLNPFRGIQILSCDIRGTNSWGIFIDDAVGSKEIPVWTVFDHVHIRDSASNGGVYIGKNSTSTTLRSCNVDSFVGVGIRADTSDGVALLDTIVESTATGSYVHLSSCNHAVVRNCWMEGNSAAFYLHCDGSYQGLLVESCTFRQRNLSNKNILNGVHVGGSGRSISIIDPEFRVSGILNLASSKQIRVDAGCEVVVSGGRVVEDLGNPSGPTERWPEIQDDSSRSAFVNAIARLRVPRLTASERDNEFSGTWKQGDMLYNTDLDSLEAYRQGAGSWAPLTVIRVPTVNDLPTAVEPGTLAWVTQFPLPAQRLQVFNGTAWQAVTLT